jgi:hypothetical protein
MFRGNDHKLLPEKQAAGMTQESGKIKGIA